MEKIEYDKTIWIKKVVALSADNMNHIENGIEQATIAINSLIDVVGSDSVKSVNLSWLEKTLVIKLYNENEELIAQSSISFDDYAKLEDVARKVDKILNPNRVYGTDGQGEQTSYPVSANVENDNIVIRDGAGQIKVPLTPTQNDHATSKKYIDDIITNIKKDHYKKVDITEYPTLNDFLASTGEEGYLYLYPIDTSEAPTFESGYYRYVWENNAWLDLGTTKIDLSDYVTLDTNQTITGTKTFNIGGNNTAFKAVNWGGQAFTIILDNGGGDGSYITYDDVYTDNFYYFKLPQKSGEFALLEDFETETSKNQTTAVIVGNAVTNINGRVFQNYTATLVTSGSYIYYQILKNGNYPTEGEAKEYMKYMTGSTFLPRYNYDFPKQTLFIFSDGSIWKPQYSNTDGLRLYRLQKSYNEIFVDLDSAQTITGAKTFSNGINFGNNVSVQSNSYSGYQITINNTNVFTIYENYTLANSLRPNVTNIYDLGSSSNAWKDLHLSDNLILHSTYNSGTTYSFEADDTYGQLRVAHGSTRLLTINDTGIMPNGTRDLGSSSYPWQDLYLNGKVTVNNNSGTNSGISMESTTDGGKIAAYSLLLQSPYLYAYTIRPYSNNSYDLGTPSLFWRNLYLYGRLSDGMVSTTIADIYDSIYNTQNTVSSGDSLSATQFNTIDSDTNISVDNKYTGYEELKGLFVNTHTTNSIVVTFLRGLKGFLCNDDNVVFNGTDQITIPANTSIEFSIVNGFMCAVNFDA